MPVVEIRVGLGGKIEADYMGFSNNMCDEVEIFKGLKRLSLKVVSEVRKDGELLQEETQFE
jgi:hypothetical protein